MQSVRTTRTRLVACAGLALALALAQSCNKEAGKPEAEQKLPPDLAAFRAEINKAKAELDYTMEALNVLVSDVSGDLKTNYDAFAASLADLKSQSEIVTRRGQAMRSKGASYFNAWEEQLKKIATPEIAAAAQKRHAELEKSYTELASLMSAAGEAYKPIVATLTDLKKILENDLNPAGAQAIAPKAKELGENVKALKDNLDKATTNFKDIVAVYTPTK